MARKAVTDGGKRDEIIAAAMECFFEKGYDGTSIRTIMKRAGGEIGLFYYYFDSKDEVFDKVLDLFFAKCKKGFAAIADSVYRDPFRTMTRFFEYMQVETFQFREKYKGKIHRTVLWAIREHMLTIIVPYIRQIIKAITDMHAKLPLDLDVTAVLLAHGVGSLMMHEDSEWMLQNVPDTQKAVYLMMGLDLEWADLMFPQIPEGEDVWFIVKLAEEMKEQFPGFVRTEFEEQLLLRMKQQEAFVIRHLGETVGCILFSRERNEIDFLAVSPNYQGRGVATRLLITAMSEFPIGTELSVVTYREGDPLGCNARRFYQKFGFQEGELLTVFNYPCQQLIGHVPENVIRGN